MARPKKADTAVLDADTGAGAVAVEERIDYVDAPSEVIPAQEPGSTEADAASDEGDKPEGDAAADGADAASETGAEESKEPATTPEEHPDVRAARMAQAAADRRADQADRELREIRNRQEVAERAEKQRQRRELAERDPEQFAAEVLREEDQEAQRQRERGQVYADADRQIVTQAFEHGETLFPDLSRQEMTDAYNQAAAAAQQQGRGPIAAEVLAWFGEARVQKVATAIAAKDEEIKTLKEQNEALTSKLASGRLDDEEGPDSPAPTGGSGALSGKIIDNMTDEEYDRRRDEIMSWSAEKLRGR